MRVDPIIQELHAVRQQLINEAGGDLSVAIQRANEVGKRYRATHKCKVIKAEPRRPFGWISTSTKNAASRRKVVSQ